MLLQKIKNMKIINNKRSENINSQLQLLMAAVPVSSALFSLFYLGYWYYASSTGRPSDALYWFAFFSEAVAIAMFFAAILYLSKGWSMSRRGLNPVEVPQIWIIVLTIVLLLWLYTFFSFFFVFLIVVKKTVEHEKCSPSRWLSVSLSLSLSVSLLKCYRTSS